MRVCQSTEYQGDEQKIPGKAGKVPGTDGRITPDRTIIHRCMNFYGRYWTEPGYGDYVAAMPGGAQRRANLDMLIEKARAYEATSYKGLFHFVRYIEQPTKV